MNTLLFGVTLYTQTEMSQINIPTKSTLRVEAELCESHTCTLSIYKIIYTLAHHKHTSPDYVHLWRDMH